MSRPSPVFRSSRSDQAGCARGRPIGSILMENGTLRPSAAVQALTESRRSGAPLPQVLISEDLASPDAVLEAQALHYGAMRLHRDQHPPDPDLAGLIPPETCLRHAVLPWRWLGDTLVLATSRPESFETATLALPESCGKVAMALALESEIQAEIAARHGDAMARRAETQVPAEESCRDMNTLTPLRAVLGIGFAAACLSLLLVRPGLFFSLAAGAAVLTLCFAQAMKIAAFLAGRRPPRPATGAPGYIPAMSILVPLFREESIARDLLRRLARLEYPRACLEVLLILEARDATTRAALSGVSLPPWMRVVEVPDGPVTTKPRALNYALRFARGEIVGIYDAEDSPASDQLLRVAGHFGRAPPEVACLQGILDFYNPKANWLSRCFTIEYATWFRILLPGLARLGFAVPLGGTTVFFRRDALEKVGGWDAHNVTEDADLGIRLARHGYVTELLPIVTREEANNRFWPWIRQRSRWLKGYMITWAVHMRSPARLWRDLGAWKFLGVQLIFLTAILQFLLAPTLWAFWLALAGWEPPVFAYLGDTQTRVLFWGFLGAEAVSLLIGVAAVSRSPHGGLLPWVPTLFLYFPLGTVAAYKAAWEMIFRPFFWDKTAHGKSAPDHAGAEIPADEPP
ncbi:glycosyltransferase [Salipiger sp. P9]|uniref:glycosyltransferase family 2 protein n=1 Tax=Salipiger pentaromativorans TaxID=2943193 RepID=UPI00215741F5|nr:glycosyltransferase family 2 protein [Salipiger pentaromativorans]MCR8550718.1 glycosyltransferase [Salipiger pentaromativorans]